MRSEFGSFRTVLFASLVLCALVSKAPAQEPDLIRNYAEALRIRSLFLLAEESFTRALKNEKLTPGQQSEYTLQLSITLFDHGVLETGPSRQELWDRSRGYIERFLKESNNSPRLGELRNWLAVLSAEQATITAWEAGLTPEDESLQEMARTRLKGAIGELHSENQHLSAELAAMGANSRETASEKRERAFFKQRAQYHLAHCDLCLAELSPTGRERTALLIDANNLLELIGRFPAESSYALKATLLKARVARLQGDDLIAERLLTAAIESEKGSGDLDQLLAERLRLEISRGRLDTLFDLLKKRLAESTQPNDELRTVIVQALILAAEKAASMGEDSREKEYQNEAQTQAAKISGRWRREAIIRIERVKQDREFGAELGKIVRQANAAWQSGQRDAATRLFIEANRQAFQSGKLDQAIELGMKAASILIQSEQWRRAATLLLEVRDQAPNHARAAEVDLLRCYALGRLNPSNQEFINALREHLQRYPASSSRWDAVRMLAVAAELQGHHKEALEWYQQIPDDVASRDEADSRSLTLLLQQIKHGMTSAASPALADQCRQQVERSVRRLQATSSSWTPQQCRILLQCVQLLSSPILQSGEIADRLLERIQQRIDSEKATAARRQEKLPAEWIAIQQTTWQLKIVSLAAQKKTDEARELLHSFETGDPVILLTILTGLNQVTDQFQPDQRYELGHLQLQAIQRIEQKRSDLTPEQLTLLDQATAEARVAVNDWSGAIAAYQKLLKASPKDRRLIKELILVSLKQGLPADLDRAKALWRQLESEAKPGSADWIEARLEQAEILIKQKDLPAAKKIVAVMRTLYPQMGTPALNQKANALWQTLK